MGIKKLYLLIDEELVKKAGDHGIIISRFLENKLKEYFIFIDEIIKKHNITEKDKRPGRNLNPSPELDRLG